MVKSSPHSRSKQKPARAAPARKSAVARNAPAPRKTAGKPARPKAIREMAKARVREVLASSKDPLAVLIEIANDPGVDVQVRVQAATSCAPYMFPRLSATVVATAPMSARDDTANLVERLMQRFTRLVPPAVPEPSCLIEGEPIAAEPSTVAA